MSATAKNYPITAAPKRIALLGDKTKRPEPAEHIIEFPGGAIEVSRCSDGLHYWAHIIIHATGAVMGDDASLRESKRGRVVASRVQRATEAGGLGEIADADTVTQIAVLVRVGERAANDAASSCVNAGQSAPDLFTQAAA